MWANCNLSGMEPEVRGQQYSKVAPSLASWMALKPLFFLGTLLFSVSSGTQTGKTSNASYRWPHRSPMVDPQSMLSGPCLWPIVGQTKTSSTSSGYMHALDQGSAKGSQPMGQIEPIASFCNKCLLVPFCNKCLLGTIYIHLSSFCLWLLS